MNETDLNERLHAMFQDMVAVLETTKRGFLTGRQASINEAKTRLGRMLTSNLPFTEELVKKEAKDEIEKKYLNLLPHLQLMAGIIRNLINENKKKIESHLLFTDKAVEEIKHLYSIMEVQLRDTTDYILTRNPHLKMHVEKEMENLIERAADYTASHEIRLITGVCMPKASYSYIALIDLIRGVSRELTAFAQRL